jgi:hypothetical protein
MRFTVTNNRPTESERLPGLSAKAAVAVGQPNAEAAGVNGTRAAVRLERLDPKLRPGTSADVNFQFENAGDMTVRVPVEACPNQAS